MAGLLSGGQIILAREIKNMLIVGSIFVKENFAPGVGELGMLAVSAAYLRRGLGKLLVGAAEEVCRSKHCSRMRLELLTPRDSVHAVKVWLDAWYSSLGYVKGLPEDFGQAFPRIQPLLACDCIFTVYMKEL